VPSDKEAIKEWLRANGRDRNWLAHACGVDKRTVDNWLSSPRPIPHKALRIIEQLISGQTDQALQNLVLQVDPPTFERYNRAAMSRGLTITEWALDALNRAARLYPLETEADSGRYSSKVAEGDS
jgi:DNA-binding transcriptional regulator YdaS (Cro superfamily)